MTKTLFDKVWDSHVIEKINDGPDVLFIDRHFIHEVTSPVAFVGLKNRNLKVLYPERTFATADHNTPTINQHLPIKDRLSAIQVKTLEKNCNEHNIDFWGLGHKKNGIVHVIGPENGITQPGLTIVCGDSHTSTHGAFGAIAFGIGTSEVEMVLACQSIMQQKPMKMRINVNGKLNDYVTPKDVAIFIISKLSSSGATGYFVEYSGDVFEEMSMEGRMTVCNLSIEMGARGGMIAPDKKTFEYIKGREYAPKDEEWDKAVSYWSSLKTDGFDISWEGEQMLAYPSLEVYEELLLWIFRNQEHIICGHCLESVSMEWGMTAEVTEKIVEQFFVIHQGCYTGDNVEMLLINTNDLAFPVIDHAGNNS